MNQVKKYRVPENKVKVESIYSHCSSAIVLECADGRAIMIESDCVKIFTTPIAFNCGNYKLVNSIKWPNIDNWPTTKDLDMINR